MYQEFEELFYKRLVQLHAEKGVSARDMSLSLGQSEGYINGIENKNGFPSMTAFFYICDYLGVTPGEFFDDSNNYPVEVRDIVAGLKKLNKEQLNSVATLVKSINNSH